MSANGQPTEDYGFLVLAFSNSPEGIMVDCRFVVNATETSINAEWVADPEDTATIHKLMQTYIPKVMERTVGSIADFTPSGKDLGLEKE